MAFKKKSTKGNVPTKSYRASTPAVPAPKPEQEQRGDEGDGFRGRESDQEQKSGYQGNTARYNRGNESRYSGGRTGGGYQGNRGGGGGRGGDVEFDRITGLFPGKRPGTISAFLNREMLDKLASAKEDDVIGASEDRNGKMYLWIGRKG